MNFFSSILNWIWPEPAYRKSNMVVRPKSYNPLPLHKVQRAWDSEVFPSNITVPTKPRKLKKRRKL